MIDYHSELQALVDACESFADPISGHRIPWQTALDRARVALAEPEPVRPTDEEIMELMPQQMRDDLAAAARALAGFDPDNIKAASVFRIILNRHSVDHARAVLAHWSNTNTSRSN